MSTTCLYICRFGRTVLLRRHRRFINTYAIRQGYFNRTSTYIRPVLINVRNIKQFTVDQNCCHLFLERKPENKYQFTIVCESFKQKVSVHLS